jgi:hypothetical protein
MNRKYYIYFTESRTRPWVGEASMHNGSFRGDRLTYILYTVKKDRICIIHMQKAVGLLYARLPGSKAVKWRVITWNACHTLFVMGGGGERLVLSFHTCRGKLQ